MSLDLKSYILDREGAGLGVEGKTRWARGAQIFKQKIREAKKGHEMVVWGSKSRFANVIQKLVAKLDILVGIEVLNI